MYEGKKILVLNKTKVYIIIVIYNMSCKDSVTVNYIDKMSHKAGVDVIICDNSTDDHNINEDYCNENEYCYIDMNGNKGLSKAYNAAIMRIHDKDAWIILLDQDTELDVDFLAKMKESIMDFPNILVHVPIVLDDAGILSPTLINHYRSIRIKDPFINNPNLSAINSGMMINLRAFEKIGLYEESLFLEYIDHYFLRKYRENNGEIIVVDTKLFQNFSENDHTNIDGDLKRFSIYLNDFKIFCNTSFYGKLYYYLKILYRGMKLSLIYKDLRFIKKVLF